MYELLSNYIKSHGLSHDCPKKKSIIPGLSSMFPGHRGGRWPRGHVRGQHRGGARRPHAALGQKFLLRRELHQGLARRVSGDFLEDFWRISEVFGDDFWMISEDFSMICEGFLGNFMGNKLGFNSKSFALCFGILLVDCLLAFSSQQECEPVPAKNAKLLFFFEWK